MIDSAEVETIEVAIVLIVLFVIVVIHLIDSDLNNLLFLHLILVLYY